MVWDKGTWEPLGGSPEKDLDEGKLHFAIHGTKLDGEWTLVRIKGEDHGDPWLLIKSGADLKPISKRRDDESCLTKRTMSAIARAKDAVWQSDGTEKKKSKPPPPPTPAAKAPPRKRTRALAFIPPMKATLLTEAPQGEWHYELKFDGYRALALKSGSSVQLFSRNKNDFSQRFATIAQALAELDLPDVILDGEVVAMDKEGRPSFQLLQNSAQSPSTFFVFDMLSENGQDLRDQPLEVRRQRLEKLLGKTKDPIRFSPSLGTDATRLLKEVCRRGLEGLIGKRSQSVYEAGRRSASWIKLKCGKEQEFVIGGYTLPKGTREHFGALLIGVYEDGELKFSGKCGSGFNTKMLGDIFRKMHALQQDACPFKNLPERTQGRWSQNITPREMKLCRWIRPELVGQVKFAEWTDESKLRHPVFLGLREDKKAKEVVHERAKKPSA